MRWLVRKAMCALYPSTDEVRGVDAAHVDQFLDRYAREAPPLMRAALVLGSGVFAATPVITIGVPLPAFALPRRALDRHAHAVSTHRIYLVRQAVFVVKLAAGLCWGADGEVRGDNALDPYPDDPGTWRTE